MTAIPKLIVMVALALIAWIFAIGAAKISGLNFAAVPLWAWAVLATGFYLAIRKK